MPMPEPIVSGRTGRTYRWQPLDPSKAEDGATHGLRGPRSSTFLLKPWGIVAVGLWSGTCESFDSVRREIELVERKGLRGDADRSISRATFDGWLT